ncbi:Leucine-rich repeat typical subtype [Penicillium brevicompactum]|uniref:Leucine-rich repeat typical subtype n=1 Tax=Penicillium brevicompactum TaxID=5074 RepID=A0A9W9QNQ8_PENBR|nr:Leucine-rich repeat typical subtype [Penicillium brevicompactum]
MDGEIPLPPPRRIRHRSPALPAQSTNAVSSLHRTRRLSRFDDRSSQPSSDPALFSSDDVPASGLENYHAPTPGSDRKRRYRGTWWGEQVIDPKRKRRDFKAKRNVDSGVWMGSDESGAESLMSSESSAWGEDLRKSALTPKNTTRFNNPEADVETTPTQIRASFKSMEEPAAHRLARQAITDALEQGKEAFDLGHLELGTLPEGLLEPLQHFTRLPPVGAGPVSEDAFDSLHGDISIYLSNNCLQSVPRDLLGLSNIKHLSLRNNNLTKIPSSIRQLTSLEDLNIGCNQLTYLPWELIWLMKNGNLKKLNVRQNPLPLVRDADVRAWWKGAIDPSTLFDATPPRGFVPNSKYEEPLHICTSPITYYNEEGNAIDPPTPRNMGTATEPSNSVPSLRELALREVCKLTDLEKLTDEEISQYPPLVAPLIRKAIAVRLEGGRICSVCERPYVIPRAEWTEWWDVTSVELQTQPALNLYRPIPFRRHCCSLSCAPKDSGPWF